MNLPAASDRPCPAWGDLVEYRLETSARQEQLRAHVSGCPACQQTLAEFGRRTSADAADEIAALPERFWDDQRRAIMSRLPDRRCRTSVFRLWPALAASFCTALLGLGLLWQFAGVSQQRPRPAAVGQVSSDTEDRLINALIDRATASPSREWIDSLTSDPELRSIREVYGAGDTL